MAALQHRDVKSVFGENLWHVLNLRTTYTKTFLTSFCICLCVIEWIIDRITVTSFVSQHLTFVDLCLLYALDQRSMDSNTSTDTESLCKYTQYLTQYSVPETSLSFRRSLAASQIELSKYALWRLLFIAAEIGQGTDRPTFKWRSQTRIWTQLHDGVYIKHYIRQTENTTASLLSIPLHWLQRTYIAVSHSLKLACTPLHFN